MVVKDQVVAMGYLNLSAMRAFDSTDETVTRWVKALAHVAESNLGDGHVIVDETHGRILAEHDLVRKVNYINVSTIGHVSYGKETLTEALTKIGPIVIADSAQSMRDLGIEAQKAAEKFARSFVTHVVEEFNHQEYIKYTRPHITEKPYGREHRKRFRR